MLRARLISAAALVLLASSFASGACSSDPEEAGGTGGTGGNPGEGGGGTGDVPAGCSVSDPDVTPVDCSDIEQTDEPKLDDAIFAVNYVYGDESRERVKDQDNIWKYIGFDIDGKATDASSASEHCQPVGATDAGAAADPASVMTDGNDGIDNAFLKSIAPIIHNLDKPGRTWVDGWNTGIGKGGATIVVRLPGLELPAEGGTGAPGDGSTMPGMGYTTVRLCTNIESDAGDAGDAGVELPPLLLPVDRSSVCNGDVTTPLWQAPEGKFDGDKWTSGHIDEAFVVIPFNGASLRVHLLDARMELTLSADRRSATLGTVGGVIDAEELVNQLTLIKGAISALACNPQIGAIVFAGYMDKVRKAADIMSDGTQNPDETCSGISVGLGFDARLAKLGKVVQVPPVKDTCVDQ